MHCVCVSEGERERIGGMGIQRLRCIPTRLEEGFVFPMCLSEENLAAVTSDASHPKLNSISLPITTQNIKLLNRSLEDSTLHKGDAMFDLQYPCSIASCLEELAVWHRHVRGYAPELKGEKSRIEHDSRRLVFSV